MSALTREDREILERLGLKRGELGSLGELVLARRVDALERRLAALEAREPVSLASIARRFTRAARAG